MSLTTEQQEGAEPMSTGKEEATTASVVFGFLARPVSLLRHAAHGCAGYLVGLSRRRRCTAAPNADGVEAAAAVEVVEEEVAVVVEVRSRAMPQRPRGLREGPGGSGGAHHK